MVLGWGKMVCVGDRLVRVLGKLGVQGGEAGGERLERARDLAVLGVRREVQRHGALALEKRQLDVVCKEEQLGWVGRRHCGCCWRARRFRGVREVEGFGARTEKRDKESDGRGCGRLECVGRQWYWRLPGQGSAA